MFWIKNRYTPVNPIFTIKVGYKGYTLDVHVILMPFVYGKMSFIPNLSSGISTSRNM